MTISEKRNYLEAVLNNAIYIFLFFLLLVPSVLFPNFVSGASLTVLVKNTSLLGVMSVGMAFVMIAGESDLSIGINASLLGIVAIRMGDVTDSLFLIIAVVFLCGIVTGLINGILVGVLHVNAYVATLGTMNLFRGLAMLLSGSQTILNRNPALMELGSVQFFSIGTFRFSLMMAILVVCIILSMLILRYTKFGQSIYVLGGNREAAKLCGINSTAVIISCYVISGLCAAITGIMIVAFQNSCNPATGVNYAIQTIAACVLGGIRMTGGTGSSFRAVLGTMCMQLITKVIYQLDTSLSNLQTGILGVILLIMLTVDTFSTKVSRQK